MAGIPISINPVDFLEAVRGMYPDLARNFLDFREGEKGTVMVFLSPIPDKNHESISNPWIKIHLEPVTNAPEEPFTNDTLLRFLKHFPDRYNEELEKIRNGQNDPKTQREDLLEISLILKRMTYTVDYVMRKISEHETALNITADGVNKLCEGQESLKSDVKLMLEASKQVKELLSKK